MALTTWARARKIIDDKLNYILNTDLSFEIDEINDTGIDAENYLEYPQQIVVGSNSIAMESASNPIDYPLVAVYEVASKNDVNDIVDSQDDVITFELVGAVASDAGNIAWAQRSAKYLALAALTAIEAGLPDAPGAPGTQVVYRVDPLNTSAGATQPVKDGRLYMSAFAVRFDVYSRVNINYAPRLIDSSSAAINPHVDSLFDVTAFVPDITMLFSTFPPATIGTANPNNFATCTLSAAQLADALNVVISDVTSTYGVDDGSLVSIINQTAFTSTTVNVSGDAITIPVASLTITDGDEWILVIKTQFNVPIFIPLLWDVTVE